MTAGGSLLVIPDEEQLQTHLDGLNEAGIQPHVVGVDRHGNPFLAFLQGAYADSLGVLLGNPWDGEAEYGLGNFCDECGAKNHPGPADLAYPVSVLHVPQVPA